MATPPRRTAGWIGSLALALGLVPAGAQAASLDELRACLAENVPSRSSALDVALATRDRAGNESGQRARVLWKRSSEGDSRSLVCMTDPPALSGLAYLVVERPEGNRIYGYLPDEERVLRMHPRHAASQARIARTAITQEDLRYFPVNLSGVEAEDPAGNILIGGRPVTAVRLVLPPRDLGSYARVVAYIDDETCVPLKIEFYVEGDELRKTVTARAETIAREGGIHLARSLRITDVKHGIATGLRVESIDVDPELPEALFTEAHLERGGCAR